jgi:hypothetical protein
MWRYHILRLIQRRGVIAADVTLRMVTNGAFDVCVVCVIRPFALAASPNDNRHGDTTKSE